MEKLFRALGADWGAFRALLEVDLRMDFRGRRASGKGRRSPVVRSIFFYSLMGSTLALSLVSRTTLFTYTLLTFSYSMVMMAFAVILEFGNSLVHPEDADILLHRPLTSRTYFLARLVHVLVFVAMLGTALCFVPAVLGLLVRGADWRFPLAYLPASMAANLASSALVVYLYTGLIRLLPHERFKDALASIQIGLTFVVFFAYQLLLGFGRASDAAPEAAGLWLYAAPPAWFAGMVRVLTGGAGAGDHRLALMGAGVTVLLAVFGFGRISSEYTLALSEPRGEERRRRRAIRPAEPSSGGDGPFSWKRMLGRDARAGYELTRCMLRSDRGVKMGVYPLLGIPLAMLVLSIVRAELVDPFLPRPAGDFRLSDLAGGFLFYMVYHVGLSVRFSRHWEASWIFHAAPLRSPGRLISGVKLAILMRLLLPFFLVWAAILAVQIPWAHGLKHTGTLFFACLMVLAHTPLRREFPFSKPVQRGDRSHRWISFLLLLPAYFLLILAGTAAYRRSWTWWAAAAVLMGMGVFLEFAARKRSDRILALHEYAP